MFILGMIVGFACGYGVREYISQLRHAAGARELLARNQQPALSRQEHVDRLKVMATSARPVTKLKR
jgi:hypothetical protein